MVDEKAIDPGKYAKKSFYNNETGTVSIKLPKRKGWGFWIITSLIPNKGRLFKRLPLMLTAVRTEKAPLITIITMVP